MPRPSRLRWRPATPAHPVDGTVHAANAGRVIQRMIQRYPTYAQRQTFTDVVQISRLLMSQTLVARAGGGRVCLRDWLVLTPDRQEELLRIGYERNGEAMKRWMESGDGARDMIASINKKFTTGTISPVTYREAIKRYGGDMDVADKVIAERQAPTPTPEEVA